jgi:hypothetical protein
MNRFYELLESVSNLFDKRIGIKDRSKLRKLVSKFTPRQKRDEKGNKIYYKVFNKQQLVGTLIRVNKHLAYRVIKGVELSGDGRMVDGKHELIKVKLR